MRYKVTPEHIFSYGESSEIDIFEIQLRKKWESKIHIIQTEEQYISAQEENKELYDIVSRRYMPIIDSGVYAYDLVYSQKYKNYLPFLHHARTELIRQDLCKHLATWVKNWIIQTILFPPNIQEQKHLAEQIILHEILSLRDIAVFGVTEGENDQIIQIELPSLRLDDFVLLGR